jgi:hypothetical protein
MSCFTARECATISGDPLVAHGGHTTHQGHAGTRNELGKTGAAPRERPTARPVGIPKAKRDRRSGPSKPDRSRSRADPTRGHDPSACAVMCGHVRSMPAIVSTESRV